MNSLKALDRALVLAEEYAAERARGDGPRMRSIRTTIEDLVGEYADGKLVIPTSVRRRMGIVTSGPTQTEDQRKAEQVKLRMLPEDREKVERVAERWQMTLSDTAVRLAEEEIERWSR
jgi:K+-sensing histidine kinase KdpD